MKTSDLLILVFTPALIVAGAALTLTALTIRDHYRAKHTNKNLNGKQK